MKLSDEYRAMKLVGVTQRVVVDAAYSERRDALDQRWTGFLAACDLLPLVLPNCADLAVALVERVKPVGILLTGGNDLGACGGDAPERDKTEAALLVHARKHGLPVLGVCRGMQAILHSFGIPLVRVPGHVATSHDLMVDGAPRHVNSFHGFAAMVEAMNPDSGLRVMARTADGVIEAVRHVREPVAGLMWHPERVEPFDAADIAFFVEFLKGES